MRRLGIAAGVVAVLVLGALGLTGAGAATGHVAINDNSFAPKTITVQQGDTVVWNDAGANPHTVTADGGAFDSSGGGSATLSNGQTFSNTFNASGTYAYHCKIHGAAGGVGMSGVVIVQAASTPTSGAGVTATTTPASPTARAMTGQPRFTG
jgi:plastocyanin